MSEVKALSRRHNLVDIAPAPVFTGLEGLDKGMAGRMKMSGSVLVFRRVAAAYVSAGKAEPQVDPLVSGFHTIFADVLVGCGDTNLIFVLAIHRLILVFCVLA